MADSGDDAEEVAAVLVCRERLPGMREVNASSSPDSAAQKITFSNEV
jgi:hypothetical protein